jgi:O-antigen/teichoic acid export membrane protein
LSAPGLRARVGRQAALYGLGIILGKALSFVALPIYTRLLTPADYGVIQLIEMTFDMLTILAGSRLAVGVFRFYHKADNNVDRRAVLTTALILLFTTFSIIAVAAWIAAPSLSRLIFRSDEFTGVIRIASLSFPWDGILGVPLAYLRLRDRAGAFVGIGLIKSLMQLVGVFILLAHFDMGVRGVFLSTLIANTLVGTALVTLLLRETGLRFSRQAGRDLFRFGMPLVVTQVATFFTTFGDRYFLQASQNETQVGIYALAYTFGFLLFTIGYTPFSSVWDPIRFEIATREDRDPIFNRAFIHMNVLLFTAATGIGVFAGDLLRLMSDPAFWPAVPLVPIILVAYILQGWAGFQEIGILVREQTRYVTIANWAAALVALVGYATLIPRYGGWGAAWTTAAAFALRAGLIYRFSQQLWPLHYTWTPIIRLFLLSALTVGTARALPELPLGPSILVGFLLMSGYLAGVWLLDIIPVEERVLLSSWARNPALAYRQIKGGLNLKQQADDGVAKILED